MKSILLKIDDELFEELEEVCKETKTSKTSFIKKAIIAYQKKIEEIKLNKQLVKESWMVREDSMEINKEFESTLLDGLDDY
jgi:metal-responsive CopG/Arc/MetJ family transcriptional regulator